MVAQGKLRAPLPPGAIPIGFKGDGGLAAGTGLRTRELGGCDLTGGLFYYWMSTWLWR